MLAPTKVNLKPGQLLIDGLWVDASKKFDTINPASGEVLTEVAEASSGDVDRAVVQGKYITVYAKGAAEPRWWTGLAWRGLDNASMFLALENARGNPGEMLSTLDGQMDTDRLILDATNPAG